MFGPLWKMSAQMVEAFIPGVGKTFIPAHDVVQAQRRTPGLMIGKLVSNHITATRELSQRRYNPVFILSKSKVFRKRVARILYGPDEEDYFLGEDKIIHANTEASRAEGLD